MRMTGVSDESMMTNNSVDSPSVDDANVEGEVGGNIPLKKGPWTSAEDAILVEYVTKHGEGNWNAVQKYSGLARCGKSCRLRWANHLRPNLRKGAFTPEEERHIIELHAKMGNKWARMAAELPGRTDNEIKNYWNTRIKRRQRAGLPIYPPDVCSQSLNDNQHSDNMNNFSSGGVHHQDSMPINNFEIPAVEFKILELNDHLYTPPLLDFPAGTFLDFPASSLHGQGLNSSYPNKSLLSSVHPSKRPRGSESYFPRCLQGSESPFPGLNAPICNAYTGRSQYQTDIPVQIAKSMMFSSSEPTWAMELELPSFQNHIATLGSPSPSSPLPFYESVDILIQTPPNEHVQSCNLSPQNSGLLDAVLYESETVKNSKSNGFSQMDNSHVVNEMEWGAYNEQLSPLGYSSSSVLSESTPISETSLDEPPYSAGTLPENNCRQVQYDDQVERNNEMIFFRPDLLLASDCFGAMEHPNKDPSSLNNAIGTLLSDDLSRDYKKIDEDATLPTQGHACDSDAWNAMPTV